MSCHHVNTNIITYFSLGIAFINLLIIHHFKKSKKNNAHKTNIW